MTVEREVWVDQNLYHVVLSDERVTLLAAKAAGRVIVGLLHEAGRDQYGKILWKPGEDLSCARYLTEAEQVDPVFLERVVRREFGLPWTIAQSDRIVIREFTVSDISQMIREKEDTEADAVFYTPELLESYIRDQYGFYECGIWAVVRKADKRLVGKAGVIPGESSMELGYHIFAPYRRQGYGKEACGLILDYVREEYSLDGEGVTTVEAKTKRENTASIRLLQSLGFEQKIPEACLGEQAPGDDSPEDNHVLWFQKQIE